jgi:hypothetical protein
VLLAAVAGMLASAHVWSQESGRPGPFEIVFAPDSADLSFEALRTLQRVAALYLTLLPTTSNVARLKIVMREQPGIAPTQSLDLSMKRAWDILDALEKINPALKLCVNSHLEMPEDGPPRCDIAVIDDLLHTKLN